MLKIHSESSIVILEAISQKLGSQTSSCCCKKGLRIKGDFTTWLLTYITWLLTYIGIAIIVLNYYDSLTNRRGNTREIDEQEWRS